jgi:glycosyltransferase involved in cell wall biosynthesis
VLEKPIVCTNFPTVVHIIEHEKTGLICEMNPESIANSISRFIDNPEFKNEIINNLKNPSNEEKEITLKRLNELMDAPIM